MSSLRDIRRQLHSIENIKKITDTMERVAAARLRNAQAKAELSRPYIRKLKGMLKKLALAGVPHPFFEQRKVKKVGLVVISGDRGLSGSFNTNIISKADHFLKKRDPGTVELYLVGRKAIEHFHRRPWHIRFKRQGMLENNTVHDLKVFSDMLVQAFLSGEVDEIFIIYTDYHSIMRRTVILEKFLTIGSNQFDKHSAVARLQLKRRRDVTNTYFLEPNVEEILAELLPRYCTTRIQKAFYESHASELAARIVAMQTASKNSEEMIERLTLVKNKTRQRDITREMIEIITGAEGFK